MSNVLIFEVITQLFIGILEEGEQGLSQCSVLMQKKKNMHHSHDDLHRSTVHVNFLFEINKLQTK